MKFKMALAAAAMVMLGASAAQAQLDVVLDLGDPLSPTSVTTATPPEFVTFSGTIFNVGTSAVTISGDSLSAPAGVTVDLPQSDLVIGSFPITLNPGDSFRGDYLFGLDIPDTQTTSFSGTYAVSIDEDLDGDGAPDFFEAQYTVNIGGAVIPEPGTVALLVSGLIGGSLCFARRRK
jgi:hypothetical protein